MRLHLYLLALLLLSSCKATQSESSQITTVQKQEESQIGFYFFEATKTSKDAIKISLIKQKIAKGQLKKRLESEISSNKWMDNHWIVSFLNTDKKNHIQLQVSNPLDEEVEFVNEEGIFEKRTIYHDKKVFVIRVPYSNSIKTITFEQINKVNNKYNPIFIDQIQL